MKEVLTKNFWEGVKKTFLEALEDPPPTDTALQIPDGGDLSASSTSEIPSSPSVSSPEPGSVRMRRNPEVGPFSAPRR